MIIIILGQPGSGKSTQSKLLAKKLGVPSVSMGQVLREAIESKTSFGIKAKEYVEGGELVPSVLIEILTRFRLEEEDCRKGFVLDGAPRRAEEAIILDKYLASKGKKVDKVYVIDIPYEVVTKRLLKRSKLSKSDGGGRKDDNMDDIKVRLNEYEDTIEATIIYYSKSSELKYINGDDSVENISKRISADLQI